MSPHDFAELLQTIEDGSFHLPLTTTMRKINSKIFVLDILWDRSLMTTTQASRQWMPDSSPQGHWNWFVNVEFKIVFPANFSSADFAVMTLPEKDDTFKLHPFITLGYGFSGIVNKVHHPLTPSMLNTKV